MDPKREWRKRQRALVNALREAGLHRATLRTVSASGVAGEVMLDSFVDGANSASVVTVEDLDPGCRLLVVEDVDDECVVPVYPSAPRMLELKVDEVTPASWRPRTRWRVASPTICAGRLVKPTGSHEAVVHIAGVEDGRWQLILETAGSAAPGDRVYVGSPTGEHPTVFDVEDVRGGLIAAALHAPATELAPSVVPHQAVVLELSIPERDLTLRVKVLRFTTGGFVGSVGADLALLSLPPNVGTRLVPLGLACSLRVVDLQTGIVEGSIATRDRVAWYNELTRLVFGFDTRLRHGDARAITRLMQESRNYSGTALRRRASHADAIAASYRLDADHPATRFRWVARHGHSEIIGHLMGIAASGRVWAAIDNVGSQSHPGRWNARVVAQWIRVFGELVAGLPGPPLVQWDFSLAAGVWAKFHAEIRGRSDLVHAENHFASIMLPNLEDGPASHVRCEQIAPQDLFDQLNQSQVDSNVERLLAAVCAECGPGSAFAMAFEAEYLRPFRRHFRRLVDEDQAVYLLTFSNHPAWTSLNQGHNFHYVIPLGPKRSIPNAVLHVIRDEVAAAGCDPYRVMYLGPSADHPPWIDLLLAPAAMSLAAEAAEAF